ncbi:MAG: hypothetical protein ACXABY_30620 [Candidatus Thorarchaeota archaeon]|jgi:chromosome segregation ATPase
MGEFTTDPDEPNPDRRRIWSILFKDVPMPEPYDGAVDDAFGSLDMSLPDGMNFEEILELSEKEALAIDDDFKEGVILHKGLNSVIKSLKASRERLRAKVFDRDETISIMKGQLKEKDQRIESLEKDNARLNRIKLNLQDDLNEVVGEVG